MNPENRWIKKASAILWAEIEEKYSSLFPSNKGNPAKPLRLALGSLLIQKQYGYSDRELVEQITENPYYQYFVGLPGYQMEAPFVPSLLVEFRKRLTDEILSEINEMIIEFNNKNSNDNGPNNQAEQKEQETNQDDSQMNSGTLMLDATCAPQHIAFPQDINLLNAARYRTRKNLAFYKEHGIRISRPVLGRQKKDPAADNKTEYHDAVDRIEVERGFSLVKRNFGLCSIWTKLDSTTQSSIALTIVAMNLHRLTANFFLSVYKKASHPDKQSVA